MTALVTDIRNYLEDLQEAVKPGNTVPYHICKNEPESHQCAEIQLLELQAWIKQDSINPDPDQSYSISDGRSPFSFFEWYPCLSNIQDTHEQDKTGCGPGRFAARVCTNRHMSLLNWAMEKGDEARPATEEHIRYMAAQKEKVPWGLWRGYTP
jgi:hypothetical protein